MQKYIKISEVENFKPSDSDYNNIEVRTDYVKWIWLVVYMQEWELEIERGFESFKFDLFWSKKARVLIEPMKRKNQKKIEESEKEFFKKSNQELTNILINNIKK